MDVEDLPGIRAAMASGEAARVLAVSHTTIVNWLEAGLLDGYSVPGPTRRRHFVFCDSVQRLQAGGVQRGPTEDVQAVSQDRDRWRARAVQAETAAALLREAFDELLAADADQARAAERLRHALAIQQRALSMFAVDDELAR